MKLASQIHDLVGLLVDNFSMCICMACVDAHMDVHVHWYPQLDRHMRRLEHDLNRFTIELEADTAGITEILEQSKKEVVGY